MQVGTHARDTWHAKIPVGQAVDPRQHETADTCVNVTRDSQRSRSRGNLRNRVKRAVRVVRRRNDHEGDVATEPLNHALREHAAVGLHRNEVELKIEIDGLDLSGSWWMADYWRRSGISQRWQLTDRQLARLDEGTKFPDAVRALQLWR